MNIFTCVDYIDFIIQFFTNSSIFLSRLQIHSPPQLNQDISIPKLCTLLSRSIVPVSSLKAASYGQPGAGLGPDKKTQLRTYLIIVMIYLQQV